MTGIVFNKSETSVKFSNELLHLDIDIFLKKMYSELDLDYPKFFKMDNLCKLGMIGTELLYRNNIELFNNKKKIGIILQNKSSSLDTDIKHQDGIRKKSVSPATFVYTLPNIVIGEISIKHKWQSEGVFFINEELDYELLSQYSNILLNGNRTEINIVGWVEVFKNQFKLHLGILAKSTSTEKLKEALS
jgi:hypothetical protein